MSSCSLPWGSATTQPRSGAGQKRTKERPITARGGSGTWAARALGRPASLAETSRSERTRRAPAACRLLRVGAITRPSSRMDQSARGGSTAESWRSGTLAAERPSGWLCTALRLTISEPPNTRDARKRHRPLCGSRHTVVLHILAPGSTWVLRTGHPSPPQFPVVLLQVARDQHQPCRPAQLLISF